MDKQEIPTEYKQIQLDTHVPCDQSNKHHVFAVLDEHRCVVEVCETCISKAIMGDMDTLIMFATNATMLRAILLRALVAMQNDKAKTTH